MLDGRFGPRARLNSVFFPTNFAFSRSGHSQFPVCFVMAIEG
jgi:hypothetical protein